MAAVIVLKIKIKEHMKSVIRLTCLIFHDELAMEDGEASALGTLCKFVGGPLEALNLGKFWTLLKFCS